MLSVQLLEYTTVQKDNSCVIGEVDFYIPEKKYTARRVRHLQKGDSKWFNWPSFSKEENGGTKWYALGEFPSDENEQIFTALRVAVENHLEEQSLKGSEVLF